MTDTPKLGLTYLEASQAQKHVTVNDALRQLDGLVQANVADKDLTAAPGSPSTGDAYIVASGATGVWAGQDDKLAVYHDTAWYFYTPVAGWLVYVTDEADFYSYNGSAWVTFLSTFGGPFLPMSGGNLTGPLGINGGTTDASNQLVANLDAALFNNDGDSVVMKLNKNATGDDASLSFQSAFTAYAQMGLLGNNDWSLKVGASATTALVAKQATGAVELTQHPKFSGYCNYDQYNAAGAWFKVDVNVLRHNDQAAVSGGTFTAPHDGYYSFGGGVRHKINGTPADLVTIGFSVNGANPTPDTQAMVGNAGWSADDNTFANTTAVLKLSSGDTVELWCYFTTNDAYVTADYNYFHGVQIA
ncbi:ribonuclease III [Paracoccus phage vB_PmaS-R3]|uniref:Ribonuclease III n=1 Tax=Paracoccus phage vB_PmaS-R3 TaxID=2494563 RepID=A0A0B5A0F6_9CAUD|nr:ribonuclease III [Paracoccus phage vB_PmaS-R3]AJD83177.1 ribonuclease III [Paracoccus phage vB_PmaS-R3]